MLERLWVVTYCEYAPNSTPFNYPSSSDLRQNSHRIEPMYHYTLLLDY